ncbi:MAG: hypothetical protein IKU58_00320 [Clostridia bacterium]|nr:hypothetical protein [Clostridia bacterium]
MSKMRKIYLARFIFRCLTLLAMTSLIFLAPKQFEPFYPGRFFAKPTLLHLLWIVWIMDMLSQLIPSGKAVTALGSQKSFRIHFRRAATPLSPAGLAQRAKAAAKRAYVVFLIWCVLTAALGILHGKGILGDLALLWVTTFFYVCDLICVLFWCPFRHFIMKNRCCTTCRIFNWDHLMMFSPLLFVDGFFARSLFLLSVVVFLVWEITVLRHPERFDEGANDALKCGQCTDRLCVNAKKIHG